MATASHHVKFSFPRRGELVTVGRVPSPLASTSNVYLSNRAASIDFISKDMVDRDQNLCYYRVSKKQYCLKCALSEYNSHALSCRWLEFKKHRPPYYRARRMMQLTPFASTDDSVAVNGTPQASTSSEMTETRFKLSQSLQGEDLSIGLVQAIHDAARTIELAFLEHTSSSRTSWFSKAWLGLDKNEWVKTLSYQAAVYSILQAAIEISSRGDGRDRDVYIFVQRSLLRQCAPLESVIREELSSKQPANYDWFWSQQHPMIVTTFVNLFERDPRFSAAATLCWKGPLPESGNVNDLSLLMLALSCVAAVIKLGSTKISCSQFFLVVPDITGRLMDKLLDFLPIQNAYNSMKDIGLRREFLLHFGPRAATGKSKNDQGAEEAAFWVDLVQKQLQRAIDRERIWSRLTTCESIEVLERDLAIFGFFIALGRSTQSFLSLNGVTVTDHPIESIIRYLIGGSVLYYPQLSSISSYQLYLEVVCEELEWLPFYQSSSSSKRKVENKDNGEEIPQEEVLFQVLDVCSYWMINFIKYSTWLEKPSNIKAARFLSKGHSKLIECKKELGMLMSGRKNIDDHKTMRGSETYSSVETDEDSFDKALEGVEEALKRLEDLLQELHLANSNSEKEHLKAACSDLERIRKLKKEAEFLEASFRAKAASLEEGDASEQSLSSASEQRRLSNMEAGIASTTGETDSNTAERIITKPRGFWGFLVKNSTRKTEPGPSAVDENLYTSKRDNDSSESNEIRRFELLRQELIELEKRVQVTTEGTQNTEELDLTDDEDTHASTRGQHMLVKAQKKDNVIAKSINKLKETSTDVWQGTQLLAIDVAAAAVLLKRALTGDELTEKEKKALRRTLTDLASVVPIGFLMLLPVTAVGHAAMLAAIQRYVPALIPSTYAPERLDLLRQLEKVKEMEVTDLNTDEPTVEISPSSSSSSQGNL